MSLADCLDKVGDALRPADRTAIESSGDPVSRLQEIDSKLDDLAERIKAAGGTVIEREDLNQSPTMALEIAPSPQNVDLAAQFAAQPIERQVEITEKIGSDVVDQVLDAFGVDAEVSYGYGGYKGVMSPSILIGTVRDRLTGEALPYDRVRALARMIGYVTNQETVLAADWEATDGTTMFVTVIPGSQLSPDELRTFHASIMERVPTAAGFTYHNGELAFANFSDQDGEDFASQLIDAVSEIETAAHVRKEIVKAELVETGDYDDSAIDNDSEAGREEGSRETFHSRADTLRKIVDEQIRAELGIPRSDVRKDESGTEQVDRDLRGRDGRSSVVKSIRGDGRDFTAFFLGATQGTQGRPDSGIPYSPVLSLAPVADFVAEYSNHRGAFDIHITTSIPGFGEIQPYVGSSIAKTFPNGARMLDIGASEGSLIKTITAMSDGKIKTTGLDPNPGMEHTFRTTSTVEGSGYSLSALGTRAQEGEVAWVEDAELTDRKGKVIPNPYAGTEIRYFSPPEQYEIINEAMVFQFISSDRENQIARVKELMAPGGLFVSQEKFVEGDGLSPEEKDANEHQKDLFKEKHFTKGSLQAKNESVGLVSETAIVGMSDLMVAPGTFEKVLLRNFQHVVQFWDSGNFRGYAASDDKAVLDAFIANLPSTESEFSKVVTPRQIDRQPTVLNQSLVQLIAQHNTTEEKLFRADALGGFSVPSLAVTMASHPNDKFGQITLLATPAMASPSRETRVFAADIYSPRHPIVHWSVPNAKVKKFIEISGDPYLDGNDLQEGPDWLMHRAKFAYDFARSNGLDVSEPVDRGDSVAKRAAVKAISDAGLYEKYERHAEQVFRENGATEKIFKGYSNQGNRLYRPHTLDDAVKVMREQLRGGEADSNIYGVGQLRAMVAPEFRSLDTMRKEATKLIVSEEQMTETKKRIEEEYFALGLPNIDVLEVAVRSGVKRALKEFGIQATDEEIQRIHDFIAKLADLPSEYFEAKVVRGVGIGEFGAAVIPHDTAKSTRDLLAKHGVRVYEYGGELPDRTTVIRQAAQESGVLFQGDTYSKAYRTVGEMRLPQWKGDDDLAPGFVVWQKLASMPELRQELKWSGIEDWLKIAGQKVSRGQVLEFIANNGLKVQVVRASAESAAEVVWERDLDAESEAAERVDRERDERIDYLTNRYYDANTVDRLASTVLDIVLKSVGFDEIFLTWDDRFRALTSHFLGTPTGDVDYHDLDLHEKLLEVMRDPYLAAVEEQTSRMPTAIYRDSESGVKVIKYSDDTVIMTDIYGNDGVVWYDTVDLTPVFVHAESYINSIRPKSSRTVKYAEHGESQGTDNYREVKVYQLDPIKKTQSNHFPQDSETILFHYRANDRDDEKTFHLRELQSDLHAKIRKYGSVTAEELANIDELRVNAEVAFRRLRTEAMRYYEAAVGKSETVFVPEPISGEEIDPNDRVNEDYIEWNRLISATDIATPINTHSQAYSRMIYRYAKTHRPFADLIAAAHESVRLDHLIPDTPFEDTKWITLGVKRALLDAAWNDNYEFFQWTNAEVQKMEWGRKHGEKYRIIYDIEMVKAVKKLTGQTPVLVDESGDPVTESRKSGYWSIPITDELRREIRSKSFSLFQPAAVDPLATFDMDSNIVRLRNASNLSSFLHESAHFFLQVERRLAKKYGVTVRQQDLLNWLGVSNFDDITVAHHERFAEYFEAYLQEGRAPSTQLRGAFSQFRSWLLRLYHQMAPYGIKLADEDRKIFDRMLASQDEIDALATAGVEYEQYFRSQEQSGMNDDDWKRYQEAKEKRNERAAESLDSKLLRDLRRARTAEWQETKAPIIEEEIERLSKQPQYLLLDAIKAAPMDQEMLRVAMGGHLSKRLVRVTTTTDGVDPQFYAEQFGFADVNEMVAVLTNTAPIRQAASAAAEERMISTHGDVLNDGSIEEEARSAMQNDAEVEMLEMEINAMKAPRKQSIDREYLKAEARALLLKSHFKDIHPGKYYRQMVRAAQNAIKFRDDPQKARDAKISQLTNHYLYREALVIRQDMITQRKHVRRVQKMKTDTRAVDAEYVANMKALANMYNLKSPKARQDSVEAFLNWHATQIADKNKFVDLTLYDPSLIAAMGARMTKQPMNYHVPTFDDLTAEELAGVYAMLKHLRFVGGQVADAGKAEAAAERAVLVESVEKNGGKDKKGTRGIPGKLETEKRDASHMFNRLSSLRNMIRTLDNLWGKDDTDGEAYRQIFALIEEGSNRKLKLAKELYERFQKEMGDIHKIGLNRTGDKTYLLENGLSLSMTSESRFMMALYWGTESSRDAIRDGFGLSDADVMKILSDLTKEQLHMVNATWRVNESLWPELSAVAVETQGVAPPKLEPLPFVINGVKMTGGHMRLFYDVTRHEVANEQEAAVQFSSVVPGKNGTLIARVGSGGNPPKLDKNNIVNALEENIHTLAFAAVGRKVRSIVNSDEFKSAVERKHGVGFYRALIDTITGVTTNQSYREVARSAVALSRLARRAASAKVLAYSIRNTMQQFGTIPSAMREVGPLNWLGATLQMVTDHDSFVSFIQSRSEFMSNRSSTVNRESRDFLNKVSVSGNAQYAWSQFVALGFTPQIIIDSLVSYPLWRVRYDQELSRSGDAGKATSAADNAVSETVGSGSDLHAGGWFQMNNPEFVKILTMFGSWFNAYYQKMYRHSHGFTEFNREILMDVTVMPFLIAVMTAVLGGESPDDDEDWWRWALVQYGKFMGATLPLVRDVVGAFDGFTPKTPLAGAMQAPFLLYNEAKSFAEDRESGLKFTSDVSKAVSTIVPVPGIGNLTRLADYTDSYNRGKEGDTFNPYVAVTRGASRQ